MTRHQAQVLKRLDFILWMDREMIVTIKGKREIKNKPSVYTCTLDIWVHTLNLFKFQEKRQWMIIITALSLSLLRCYTAEGKYRVCAWKIMGSAWTLHFTNKRKWVMMWQRRWRRRGRKTIFTILINDCIVYSCSSRNEKNLSKNRWEEPKWTRDSSCRFFKERAEYIKKNKFWVKKIFFPNL